MEVLLKANKQDVLTEYAESGKKTKNSLERIFGKKNLIGDIRGVIKNFQDVLDYAGETLEAFTKRTANDSPDEVAYKKAKLIAFALNEGEVQKYDGKKWLYFPWFRITADSSQPSGFGFSCHDWTTARTGTSVGSRLCFKSKELAEYAGRTFPEIYRILINE